MTKRLAIAFGLGAACPILFALYLGGETVAQAGLRLAAIEHGFALAQRHWQFDATPAHDVEVATWEETTAPTRKPAPTKRRAK